MTETSETQIVEQPLVSPADPKKVLEAMRRFEQFKREALTPKDSVLLEVNGEKKPYIKKSGWLKISLACQLSLEKRDEQLEDTPKGRVYRFTYRAVAPNSRFADACGSASTTERAFAHPEHDVRALAQTRAMNRAISNLVAGGELSAEEMVSEIHEESGTKPTPDSPIPAAASPEQKAGVSPSSSWKVPVIKDQATPEQIQQGVRQYPLFKDTKSFGMINRLGEETSIVPEKPIPTNTALIDGFLIRKILDPMKSKHGYEYTVQTNKEELLEAVLIRGKLEDQQLKELVSGARWAFARALEKDQK